VQRPWNGFNSAKTLEILEKCFGNDALKKTAVYQWHHDRKKSRRFQSKKKMMLTVFMDYNGVVHHEFLPKNQTVNKEYYLGVMR